MHKALALPILLLAAFSAPILAQAPATPPPAGPQIWRNIGPDRGGRSLTVAGSSARPNEYYFGAVGGGLWKTVDGGSTWNPTTDGKIHSSSVGAVAVAPSNPDIVYLGMGETELRGNVMQGDGMYKSTDAGKTWTHIGLDASQSHLPHPRRRHQPRPRLCRRPRPPLWPQPRARRLPLARRRQDLEEDPLRKRPRRRRGPFDRPPQPEGHVRHHLGRLPDAMVALKRRPRQPSL